MDQEIRNKLQRATQQVRRILEEEFAEQLEGTFDILPDGKVLPKPGKHLDGRQRLTRQKLVHSIEHIKAGGKKPQEAVDEYTREAAFTFLNRFVALRMLEARGLLQECVSKGDQSSGFKEFCGLAPGLSTLSDGGYRLYLECLCDELSVEVKVLFDRRDSASLLWPRRGALTELLDILGQTDLAGVWSEDETIGWVYQYFNSGEERKKMREESQAPRNSRELAVRNQFFTPRYVVEFLTDNTLGRIWYEMRQGQTRLEDECRYLVRRRSEVFLNEGQEPPPDDSDVEQDLSQEELLKKTVYIPHRAKKDPRDLKILDPACGSGHFLLYAFDLLISIYDEAWHDEGTPESEVTGRRLRDDYSELEQLHAALPRLVLAYNLHGIDIDPRAAQIAALALWMRGQRAFNEFQIAREQRPAIARSNIVCAESMPGEAAFLDEFIAEHLSDDAEGRFLASLVRRVFEAMKLAGEAGSLLKIEEDIAEEVAKAKKQWLERPEFKQKTLFDAGLNTVQQELDLTRGIADEAFWEEAEQRIYDALRAYAERAERSGGFQRRLFAEDAGRGFAFIDICRRRFDVVLMNPPFGAYSIAVDAYSRANYRSERPDILAAFVSRGCDLSPNGLLGAITNRTALFITSLKDWRVNRFLGDTGVAAIADLGHGVLDGALVEAAAYVLGAYQPRTAFNLLAEPEKGEALQSQVLTPDHAATIDTSIMKQLPTAPLAYWAPTQLLRRAVKLPTVEESGILPRVGLQTSNDFRFLRLQWEVPAHYIGESGWVPFAKGGEYSPFADNLHLCVNWFHDAREQRAFCQLHAERSGSARGNDASRDFEWYYKPGLTYSERTTSDISVRVLPSGCITGTSGPGIFSREPQHALNALAYFCSATFRQLLELSIGSGDAVHSGSAARHYTVGQISDSPLPKALLDDEDLRKNVAVCVSERRRILAVDPTAPAVCNSPPENFAEMPLTEIAVSVSRRLHESMIRTLEASCNIEASVARTLALSDESTTFLLRTAGQHPCSRPERDVDDQELSNLWDLSEDDLVDVASKRIGHSRQVTKKTWYVDRRIELLSAILDTTPTITLAAADRLQLKTYSEEAAAIDLLEWSLGRALGAHRSQDDTVDETDLFDSAWARCGWVADDSTTSVLCDDVGAAHDVGASVRDVIVSLKGEGDRLTAEICQQLGTRTIREAIRRKLFHAHIRRFSKSRRKAPIFWQLATASALHSVWLYYHAFTRDTFFKVTEIVKDKAGHERNKVNRLQSEAGVEPTRSQRKEIEDQEKFVAELAAMAEEVERIAPLWNPNLNDGVIINFAPLWRLVPQNKSWQKECKKVWDKLVKGEYDWAHLAMHLWPERVVPKCVSDASVAIAHGLEETFWVQDDRDRFQPREEPAGGWEPVIDELVEERTSPAVKAALKSLLEAPAPTSGTRSRRRRAAAT